ncbi:MAG: HIT domain-containing protein [Nitrospinaceae bacterium]|nr:histidine triad nucleotide-binding protein [Nitrospinaceae bacterium]NIR56219.1 histidine triad nucleotide-binding protein [Nitrospinaceae bacterium]NIS86675.1 histidine triad nucleotide-binding protein [Nitrospinaceae bacterium]NIT83508.1 histidine triad nucleotide-binding protein [Nitrospinaceae bacterium]NIU45713.1 histidine triad nucleotide-binding protein [Nitrospinaceae bacterium]
MENCLFCRIASGDESSEVVYNSADVIAIKDINPQAPLHLLIIPKKHVATLLDIDDSDKEMLGSIITASKFLAEENDLEMSGYRLVANCGTGAGQTVFHIHFHMLAGRSMTWPPG